MFILNGDKKVKVEEGFINRIRNFITNYVKKITKTNTMDALKNQGVTIKEVYANDELETKDVTENVQIDTNISEEEPIVAVELDNSAKEAETEDKPENENTSSLLNSLFKTNNDEVVKEKDEEKQTIEENNNDETIKPFITLPSKEIVKDMPEISEESPILEQAALENEPTEIEESKDEKPDEIEETNLKEEIEQEEMDTTPEPIEPAEIEAIPEPTFSEEVEPVKEIRTSNINLSDYKQFKNYASMVISYRHANVDDKDEDRFLEDFINNNLPSDLPDEKEFIRRKAQQEEEVEKKKLEVKNANLEKKIAELREKNEELNDNLSETELRLNDKETRMSNQRREIVILKQEKLDLEENIKNNNNELANLKNQLIASQEATKNVQAALYKERKKSAEREKTIDELHAQIKQLESEKEKAILESKDTENKLEHMKEKYIKEANAYINQLNSLKTASDELGKVRTKKEDNKSESISSEKNDKKKLKMNDSKQQEIKKNPDIQEKANEELKDKTSFEIVEDTKQDDQINDLKNQRQDLIDVIEKEAEEFRNREKGKTR